MVSIVWSHTLLHVVVHGVGRLRQTIGAVGVHLGLHHAGLHVVRSHHGVEELVLLELGILVGCVDGVVEILSHTSLTLQECAEPAVQEVGVESRDSSILHGEVVVFLFVHFFVHDIFLSHAQ